MSFFSSRTLFANKHFCPKSKILHYERIIKAESKFEALQDTLLGNTVVENAKVTLIEIDPNLPVQPLT
ncbi:hypothetical protein CAL7102_07389 [Dulcicalothrix desertica PCC 7102]|nr:hypothetical protein CAL7102_07389 [Dulcicalothrix desertica PCC 7102]